nr:hypothetical protein [Burkholderiaceae bacterium]
TVGTAGADTFLRMGSWSSVDVSHMESTFDRAAYIVGTPTASISDLNGLTGTYSLHSATPIYMTDGQTGVLNSATMNVNFSSGYSGGSVALGMTLGSYGNLTMSGTFNNQGSSFSVGGITLSQGEGSGSIRGLFSGPGAEYAGLAYGGGGYFGEGDYVDFNGAAILSGSTAPTNPELPANGTYPAMSTVAYLAPWGSTRLDADGSHTFSSAAPTSATGGSASYSGAVAAESGSHGTGADFIGWGRWSAGTDQASNALAGAHYVTGTPTSNVQMPITGSFNYSYVGGSTPISSAGVGGGTVTSANLSANFTDGTANASIATQFDGGLTASMSSNTMSISNGRFSGVDNNNGDGRFSGLFFGNGAGKAGFVYQMQTLNGLGTVAGAVGFEKIPGQPL